MTFQVRYRPEALAEFRADVPWYEDRGAGADVADLDPESLAAPQPGEGAQRDVTRR